MNKDEHCDNCMFEYTCNWSKAGNDMHCSEWKTDSPEGK